MRTGFSYVKVPQQLSVFLLFPCKLCAFKQFREISSFGFIFLHSFNQLEQDPFSAELCVFLNAVWLPFVSGTALHLSVTVWLLDTSHQTPFMQITYMNENYVQCYKYHTWYRIQKSCWHSWG